MKIINLYYESMYRSLFYEDYLEKGDARRFIELPYESPSFENLFSQFVCQTSQELGTDVECINPNPYCLFEEDGCRVGSPTRVAQSVLIYSLKEGEVVVYPALNTQVGSYTNTAGGHMYYQDTLYREAEEELELLNAGAGVGLSVKKIINEGGNLEPVGIVEQRLGIGINYLNLVSLLQLPSNKYSIHTLEQNKEIIPLLLVELIQIVGETPNKEKASYHLFALVDFLKRHKVWHLI